jgi:uncharacterized LabA/DUF88 family protein
MTSAIRINKVAVFVDGENISAEHAGEVDRICRELGEAAFRRVYGNVHRIGKWEAVPGFRVIHSGTGKNATDMLLAIDAMELALSDAFDTLLIASSDSDFTHLALRLRERQMRVVGVGTEQAAPSFRQSCTQFKTLGADTVKPKCDAVPFPQPVVIARAAEPVALKVTELDGKIRSLISANSAKGRGMPIKVLAAAMHKDHGFKISDHAPSWRAYFVRKPTMYAVDPKGEDACVRFIPAGFAAP